MGLNLVNPYRFGAAPGEYDAEVLADTPWMYLKTQETSGPTFADASGNARNFTLSGSPTLAQAGPESGVNDAIVFANNSGQYLVLGGPPSISTTGGGLTLEAWVYLTANPSANASVIGQGDTAIGGTTNTEFGMSIDTSGRPVLYLWNGSARTITGTALSLNAWHHVVGVESTTAGMRIRVDKVTTATSAQNSLSTTFTRNIWVHGAGRSTNGGAITIARPAIYADAALSDARIDAHYDAMP